jgi:hypothetical protein
MTKQMKVARGTARKNRRAQWAHFEISNDGKDACKVNYFDGAGEDSVRVFAPSLESAYKKAGIALPK